MTCMSKTTAPARTIRLMRSPDRDGVGVFRVVTPDETVFYTFHEVRCDIGGRGFVVHRLGLGSPYHVRVGTPSESSCECPGFTYTGRCRHVLGLQALMRQGLV
jgi:hypothetical protein